MPRNLKQSLAAVPGLGYLARLVNTNLRLPFIYDQQVENQRHTDSLLSELQKHQQEKPETMVRLEKQYNELSKSINAVKVAQDDLRGSFTVLEKSQYSKTTVISPQKLKKDGLFAQDHLMDSFYANFEDRFRGSEAMIKERLEEYLPYFTESAINFDQKPVLDIGSGRGEFIQLLRSNNISAVGLDVNHAMVERSKNKGLKAVQGDALDFLVGSKSQTYGAITGFHVVEHIPFNSLMRIFKAARRALVTDGFVIFETPNPENIIVASSGFYTDPSHLNPLPPDLLAYALEMAGMRNVEIQRLHPVDVGPTEIDGLPAEVVRRFYGPRDYAVIGYK